MESPTPLAINLRERKMYQSLNGAMDSAIKGGVETLEEDQRVCSVMLC